MSRRSAVALFAVGVAVVVAVVVASLRSHRHARPHGDGASSASTSTMPEPTHDEAARSAAPSGARVSADQAPRLPLDARFPIPSASSTQQLPTQAINDAKQEDYRQQFWQRLRDFAGRADLSEQEWERFLGDLSDVSKVSIDALTADWENNETSESSSRLTPELARELDARLKTWMSEQQWKIYDLRMDSAGLIMRVQGLRMLGTLSPAPAPDAAASL